MRITIQEVDGPNKSDKGRWQEITLTYTDQKDDSNRTKTLVSFGDGKPVYDALEAGEFGPGDEAEIELKKAGKFWNWVGIDSVSSDVAPSKSKPTSTPKSGGKSGWTPDPNRETAEERYYRNLAICRQNALTNAVNFASSAEAEPVDVNFILETADKFFQYTAQDFSFGGVGPKVTKVVSGDFK